MKDIEPPRTKQSEFQDSIVREGFIQVASIPTSPGVCKPSKEG